MSRQALLRSGVALLLVGFCVAGFFACFEQREVDVPRGASPEVRRNPYLALGRLLERMGHEVALLDDLARLAELPGPPATLILPTHRYSIGAERSQALLDWTARGGHLVVVTYSFWSEPEPEWEAEAAEDATRGEERAAPALEPDRPDPLLDRFGLRQVAGARREPARAEDAGGAAAEGTSEGDVEDGAAAPEPPTLPELLSGKWLQPPPEISWAHFAETERPLEVSFDSRFQWTRAEGVATWGVEGPSGLHLVELPHGQGRVSALTSDDPLTNAAIGSLDNAEFIVRWLRRDAAGDGPIWIVFQEEWPGLLQLARRHALPALVASALLLLLWVWRSVWRFGPLLPEPSPARRAWLEHLDAAGRFQWRQDRGRALIATLRQDVARRLYERHPAWQRLPERERAERVAAASGVTLGEAEHALLGTIGGARSFVAATSALERIRAAL